MHSLVKLTWVEIKLFVREPITMTFTLALPLIFLFVMGEVFGKTPADPQAFRGVGAMNYYVPAYIGMVIGAIGLIGLPVHLASYRERGVVRRLRASSLPAWSVFGSQLIVTLVITVVGSVLLTIVSLFTYDVDLPKAPGLVVAAFFVSVLSFVALGVFLGAVLPTTRAAQGAGLLLFFVMFILAGAGPPPEVMTQTMQWVAEAMPLTHVVVFLQDPWVGFGWNWTEFLIVTGIMVVASLLSVRFFRWE